MLARQQPESLNLGRLFNEIQDLLGADISLKVPLRDLFAREVFRKLLLADQLSQKLAFKDSLVQDLQSVYSPALVARLEAFLNGLIGSEADEQTSQLQPTPAQAIPAAVALRGPVEEEVATVMASDPASAVASSAPPPAATAPSAPVAKPAGRPGLPTVALRPLLWGGGAVLVVLGVVLISSRRPCPGGMQCSLASSFGLIKLSEAAIQERFDHITQERQKAEFVPDLDNRKREVEQLQAELKRGSYSKALASRLQSLHGSLEEQIQSEQAYYDQYKQDEAIVSSIGVVKTKDEAKRLEAAAKRLDAIPKTSLMRKAARYQAQLAAIKLRPFVAEAKAAEMQKLMVRKTAEMKAKEAAVKADIAAKERLARAEYARLQAEARRLKAQAATQNRQPAPKNNDVF